MWNDIGTGYDVLSRLRDAGRRASQGGESGRIGPRDYKTDEDLSLLRRTYPGGGGEMSILRFQFDGRLRRIARPGATGDIHYCPECAYGPGAGSGAFDSYPECSGPAAHPSGVCARDVQESRAGIVSVDHLSGRRTVL